MIKYLLLLFSNIIGAETGNETPVLAGLDAIVKFNGKTVGYATNVSIDEDFELQGIRTLGFHGDRDFKSLGYNCTMTVGTFVLSGTVDDALPIPTRATILKTSLFDFEIIDLSTKSTLYIASSAKCASSGITFDGNSLANKNTTWKVRELLSKAVS